MGITIPVYANTSILLSAPSIAGYLSVIASALSLQQSLDVSSSLTSVVDYSVLLYKPMYEVANTNNLSLITGFEEVLPSPDETVTTDQVFPLSSSPLVQIAFMKGNGSGYTQKTSSFTSEVAIGYTKYNLNGNTWWTVIVQQDYSVFTAPIKKLRNIIIGVVIGIGVFMCLLTFPLAVWFVRPITKLKEATEAITRSKKRGIAAVTAVKKASGENGFRIGSRSGSVLAHSPPPYGGTSSSINTHASNANRLQKRNSLNSTGSNSLYSYGIYLPGRIPPTKKFFKDEFLELSDAFNIMTEELEKQYTHLEDRVKIRTKELEILKIEAELANEAKTVFIANISHELRTPLNGILGMTSIAMDEQDPSRIQDSLKLIHRSGELLLHILTELLTYSKNTLNRSKLEKLNFQILEIVYQVQSIFLKLAIDQRVNLKISLMPNTIRKLIMYGDSNRIIQIVMNLVSNSLKFTPVDGSVGVTFKLLGEYDYEKSKESCFKQVYVKNHKRNKNFDTTSLYTMESSEYDKLISKSFSDENKDLPAIPSLNGIFVEDDGFDSSADNASISTTTKPLPPVLDEASVRDLSRNYFERTESYTSKNKDLEVNLNNKTYNIKKLSRPKTWAIEVKVTDTGPGIEPALQEKVFEPFIQGDQTLSRSYGGTGLGLSICRQLATMMKGTLTLDSEVGVGSTFTFTAPLPQTHEIFVPALDKKEFYEDEFNPESRVNRKVAFDENVRTDSPQKPKYTPTIRNDKDYVTKDEQTVDSPNTEKNSSLSSFTVNTGGLEVPHFDKPHLITRGSTGTANSAKYSEVSSRDISLERLGELRVLVAEDNMVNQEVIKRMLKLEGLVNITMACNGAEAIEQVESSIMQDIPFDLVFMDIQMPKVDGLLATRRIRNNLHFDGPIIALTAFADESNVKECLNSGMSGFLSKPIKRSNLRKIIHEFSEDGIHASAHANAHEAGGPLPSTSNAPGTPPVNYDNLTAPMKSSPLSSSNVQNHDQDPLERNTPNDTENTLPSDPFNDHHQHHYKNFQPLPPLPNQNGRPLPALPPHKNKDNL